MTPGAAHAASSELATLLSPTQVSTFTDCQARWWFKYGMKLADPKNAKLALGIAVHDAVRLYLQARMAAIELEPQQVSEQFEFSWNLQRDETILRDDDDPKEIRAVGRTLVSRWVAQVGPTVDPVAIEEEVEGVINGVRVQGRVDVRERNGRLRDIKTACRKPLGVSGKHAFQLATYVQIHPAAARTAVIDTMVKTKTPGLYQHAHRVDEAEIRQTRTMYPLVQEAMRAGLYVPNRASSLCSRANCAFWRMCMAEFGGRVD